MGETTMEEENKSMDNQTDRSMREGVLLLILSALCTILLKAWNGGIETELLKQLLYTIVIDFILLFYINMFKTRILERAHAWWLIQICYLGALCFVISEASFTKYPFWMLGPVLISYLVDVNLSFLITYGLLFLTLITNVQHVELILFELVIGSFLCILARFLKKATNIFYICIFIASMSITLLFIKNDFRISGVFSTQNLQLIGSYLLVVLAAFFIGTIVTVFFDKSKAVQQLKIVDSANTDNQKISTNEINTAVKIVPEHVGGTTESEEKNKELEEIISEEYPLLIKFSKEASKIYHHSMLVAELSGKAAKSIGANEQLAYAGGCYHEIGRLRGKNYVQCGLEIAEELHFPEEVKAIIRQHNYKTELPKSVEAAIVMLSDNIITTVNYLKVNRQMDISVEKVIENTFQVRLKNGTLDECGINLQTFNQLKHFYLLELIFEEKMN